MDRASDKLVGNIERVTYHSADNGFAVLKSAAKGRRDLTTVVGHLAFAIPGEFIEASGRWVVDRDHGRQLKAESILDQHDHLHRSYSHAPIPGLYRVVDGRERGE